MLPAGGFFGMREKARELTDFFQYQFFQGTDGAFARND